MCPSSGVRSADFDALLKAHRCQPEWLRSNDGTRALASTDIVGSSGTWKLHARCELDADIVTLHGMFPAEIRPERRDAVGRLLERMNRRAQFACYHFVAKFTRVVLRMSVLAPDLPHRRDLLEAHLRLLHNGMDEMFPLLMAVAYGTEGAHTVLRRRERELIAAESPPIPGGPNLHRPN